MWRFLQRIALNLKQLKRFGDLNARLSSAGRVIMKLRLIRASGIILLVLFSGWLKADEMDEKLSQKWQEYMQSEAFENRVEEVILQFIEKQNQARAEQQRKALEDRMANVSAVDPESDYIRGEQKAEFSLIEYSDFECPFCKRFHKTAMQFIEQNPEVNWVYRHFPLNFHNPGAQKQAEASECAGELGGNDAFWQYTDLIYERTRSNGKGFPIDKLAPLAVEIGLDQEAFKQCLNSEKYKQKVLQQMANGQAGGVTGTPGNFIRHNVTGTTISVHGAQRLRALKQALESLKQRQ
ncbi:DsbA family protein [Pontibacterium granulatum]|uniref:DsbA family protein n=1 Tax=Pontibacterium granulatum TaxID=2036029 RepID=UPI00249C1445|nr:DsbA family protein [Pontibacterium granulatum]MDI3325823.1 DsbA family protein [Pontibacterium granulatum]